jgi:acetylornithine deacetylase/succinyl-diaminopimelate desuccinylase-like protein
MRSLPAEAPATLLRLIDHQNSRVISEERVLGSPSDEVSWRSVIHELAAFERPSASEGERRAAEVIADRLRACGWPAAIEQEQAHGGYWWPLGLANLIAALGAAVALRWRGALGRIVGVLAGSGGAAAVWDDVGGGKLRFRRALLRHRPTWNVVAEAGDANARRTVIVVAHHDAAHSGLVFHPALGRIGPRLAPRAHARASHTLPIMHLVWGGPLIVLAGSGLGLRRLLKAGLALSLGTIAAMADIGARKAVPGANDNLSAVGVLVALAGRLRKRPLVGLRVLLVSTGSEESFMEGMQGFARRHFSALDPQHTEVLCLECLGGKTMIVLEGEGMLVMRDYPAHMREELAAAAAEAGVQAHRGLRTVAATDGLISMRAAYPTVTLASVEDTHLPLNYHWPSDTPDALHWDTVEQAIEVCDRFLRRRAVGE